MKVLRQHAITIILLDSTQMHPVVAGTKDATMYTANMRPQEMASAASTIFFEVFTTMNKYMLHAITIADV